MLKKPHKGSDGAVRTVTMLELRRNAEAVLRRARRGERMVLTYRGEPVMRLEPIVAEGAAEDDAFYRLGELAEAFAGGLTNEEIDRLVYDV